MKNRRLNLTARRRREGSVQFVEIRRGSVDGRTWEGTCQGEKGPACVSCCTHSSFDSRIANAASRAVEAAWSK
eukprot:6180571-Pleurochrysis_carterae.AAC.1